MATFRKVYGKWQARINWYENGKRRYKSKNGFATKALARAWAAENEVNLSDGIDIKKETTLISYYDYWVKTYKEPRVSSVTLNRRLKKLLVHNIRVLLIVLDLTMPLIPLKK